MTEPATLPNHEIPSMHPSSEGGGSSRFKPNLTILALVLLGAAAGFGISYITRGQALGLTSNPAKGVAEAEADVFRDEAFGTIAKKTTKDPNKFATGTHKLVRDGGINQTVYILSSIYNLDDYDGKKVKVFGETLSSENVGWLLNVGKIEEVK